MMPWYLSDLARIAHERAELDRLVENAEWLTAAEWSIQGRNLVVNFTMRVHTFEYGLRLEYPALFPSVPAIIRPQATDSRLSEHQYGAGGPLCLEWRPDNWVPEVTGAQLIESAYRLLDTENPTGAAQGQAAGEVPSAHHLTLGQQLRTSGYWMRLFVSADAAAFCVAQRKPQSGEAALAVRWHPGGCVAFIRAIRLEANEFVATLAPDDTLGTASVKARALVTTLTDTEVRAATSIAMLGDDVAEVDLSENWLFVISVGGRPHLFLPISDGQLHAFETVEEPAVSGERTPTQYAALATKRIAIVGLGSLGSKIATSLARMGVRNFLVVDDDIFFPENVERNALDWIAVAEHKADAIAEAILRIAATAQVDRHRVRLTGQESSGVIAALVARIADCDLIVDATANPRNFNVVAGAATAGRKPLVWAEVYGGGRGGVICRSIANVDPPPHTVRLAYMKFCEAHPAPDAPAANYDLQMEANTTLSASDADVAIVAHHVVRIAADCIVNSPPEHEHAVYLVGLAKWWVFEGPFDTHRLAIPREEWHTNAPPTERDVKEGAAFLLQLIEKVSPE